MKSFLKVSAVLMMTFGGYYLLMGLTLIMSSGQIAQTANEFDAAIDVAMANQVTIGMGITMLIIGLVEALAGLFGFLGARGKRTLLLVSIILSALILINSIYTLSTTTFAWELLIDLALPILLLLPGVAVWIKNEPDAKSPLRRL